MNISSTREPSIDPKLSTNQTDTKGRIQTDKSRDFEKREKSIKMKRQTRLSRQRFPLHHRWPKSRQNGQICDASERERERDIHLSWQSLFLLCSALIIGRLIYAKTRKRLGRQSSSGRLSVPAGYSEFYLAEASRLMAGRGWYLAKEGGVCGVEARC